jgi:murein DD-endopeptidase MepM/ murein hydrolase activator NlpD
MQHLGTLLPQQRQVLKKQIHGWKWKYVKVKHNGTYSTQYLHMSKILVRRERVNQGDVIGRVGSTGLATGPHVCYRFWKNGVQVDAQVKLPTGETMQGKDKERFLTAIEPLKREQYWRFISSQFSSQYFFRK